MAKEEYFTPPQEKEEPFNPQPVPGINAPRINGPTQVKNMPSARLVSRYSGTRSVPNGTSQLNVGFNPGMLWIQAGSSVGPACDGIYFGGGIQSNTISGVFYSGYIYGNQISVSFSGNNIVFTNLGGTVTLHVYCISR